jgi:DNA-binding MarR family transcriptional regulator
MAISMKKAKFVLPKFDRVLFDPSRMAILSVLYQVERASFRYLQKKCVFTPGNLSRHLARLEAAGYVAIAKGFKGKHPITVCSLTAKGRAALADCARKLTHLSGAAGGSNKTKA